MSTRKTLPRFEFDYPDGTGTRIHEEADERSKALAAAATNRDIQQWWREYEYGTDEPIADEHLDLARACYQQSVYNRIDRELWLQAKADTDRAAIAYARATVAAVYGLTPEALDGPSARKLWEAAGKHADDLDRAIRWGSSPAEKSAATRARRQCDRLEEFLEVARLMHRDDDTFEPVFAG
jgi:hypothetical protein